jgi:hypothetical protein
MLLNLDKWRPKIQEYIISVLSQHKDKSILDVGFGDSTGVALGMGIDVHAMDKNTFGKPLPPCVKYVESILDPNIAQKVPQYDIVMACEMLEHCEDLKMASENVMKLVKPNGFALITMPCFLPWHPGGDYYGDYYRVMPTGLTKLFAPHRVIEKVYDSEIQGMPYGIGAAVFKK